MFENILCVWCCVWCACLKSADVSLLGHDLLAVSSLRWPMLPSTRVLEEAYNNTIISFRNRK